MNHYFVCGLMVALLFGGSMLRAVAADDAAAWCEQQWLAQSAQYTDTEAPDYNGLLRRWQEYGAKCGSTVAYEARLALVYFFLDAPAKGRAALQPVFDKSSHYAVLVETAELLLDAKELILSGQTDEAHLRQLDEKLVAFVEKYPAYTEGHALLGAAEAQLGRHATAVELLESALAATDPANQRWGLYRNLTISYAEVGRYEEAYDAASATIALRKTATADEHFMYALAKTNAGLGKFAEARNALKLIATKKPEVQEDRDFQAAVAFVIAKLKGSQ